VRSNIPLPGVPPASSSTPPGEFSSGLAPDLQFHLGTAPAAQDLRSALPEQLIYTSVYLDETGAPVLHIWKAADESFLRLAYCDGTQFWLDRCRQNLWASWPDNLSVENTLSYLLGPVFGLILRLRGVTCLHASAVAFGDRAVVFVGSEGAGKSTTAAAFAKRGYAVLSDDIVALSQAQAAPPLTSLATEFGVTFGGGFQVLPAYPHLCLWPDSAKMLYGSEEGFPRLAPEWDKRKLALGAAGTRFESRALPLAAIYLFADRAAESAPRVEPAPRKSALLALVANTYANQLLDAATRGEEFAILDHLVSSVPVRLLTPHTDPTRLDQLCALVDADFQVLSAT